MYVTGSSNEQISGADFNVECYRDRARLSRTASFIYTVDKSAGFTIGGDVVGFDTSWGTTATVTTRAITFVMNIYLSDLR